MKLKVDKILVPIDFSQVSLDALKYAAKVAHKLDAELLLLHIIERYEDNVQLDEVVEYNKIVDDKIREKLEAIRTDNTELWGIRMKAKLTKGKINHQIETTVEEEGVDLVVMGTTGSGGTLGRFLLGSNANRVVQACPVPVITIREGVTDAKFDKIIVPLDIEKETVQKVGLAKRVAQTFGSEVHLVVVLSFFDEMRISLDKMMMKVEDIADSFRADGIKVATATMKNQGVTESVMEYAEQENADLILIMSQGENNTAKEVLLGSDARKMIMKCKRPVLSVRPKED